MASLFPANEGYLERYTPRRRGWFSGKEIWESQYFVLHNGVLSWAQSQTQAEEEARRQQGGGEGEGERRLGLRGARVQQRVGQRQEFELFPAACDGSGAWRLRALTEEGAARWAGQLERTVQKIEWHDALALVKKVRTSGRHQHSHGYKLQQQQRDGIGHSSAQPCPPFIELFDSVVGEGDAATAGGGNAATGGATEAVEVAERRCALVDRRFELGMAQAGRDLLYPTPAEEWPQWIAENVLAALRQADTMLRELATGLQGTAALEPSPSSKSTWTTLSATRGSSHAPVPAAAAATRSSSDPAVQHARDVASWFVAEYHERFMLMLRCIERRALAPGVAGADAEAEAEAQGAGAAVASSLLSTDMALATIGWCARYRGRLRGMGVPDDGQAAGEGQSPTTTALYRTLVDRHMPSFRGLLRKAPHRFMGLRQAVGVTISRYFVLEHGVLRYYTTESMTEKRGEIPGEIMTTIEVLSEAGEAWIILVWGGKESKLRARSMAEAQVWVSRLRMTKRAARSIERLLADVSCFEVEAVDGGGGEQQQLTSTVAKECAYQFDEAVAKLELLSEARLTGSQGQGQGQRQEGQGGLRGLGAGFGLVAGDVTGAIGDAIGGAIQIATLGAAGAVTTRLTSLIGVRGFRTNNSRQQAVEPLEDPTTATFTTAADALLEMLQNRLLRIPIDRVDVKTLWIREYHTAIGEGLLQTLAEGLAFKSPRTVCQLLHWIRAYDRAIEHALGGWPDRDPVDEPLRPSAAAAALASPGPRAMQVLDHQASGSTAKLEPLAMAEEWETAWHQHPSSCAYPSFAQLELPRWSGWALLCDGAGEHTKGLGLCGNRWWFELENFQLVWFATQPQPGSPSGSNAEGCVELTATTQLYRQPATSDGKTMVKVGSDYSHVLLQLDNEQFPALFLALNQSVTPLATIENAGSSVEQQLRATGQEMLRQYTESDPQALTATITKEFQAGFRAAVIAAVQERQEQRLLPDPGNNTVQENYFAVVEIDSSSSSSSSSSKAAPCSSSSTSPQFCLSAALDALYQRLDHLVSICDSIIFSGCEDACLAEEVTSFYIGTYHALFERYMCAFCELSPVTRHNAGLFGPLDATAEIDVETSMPPAVRQCCVVPAAGKEEVVELLRWCRDYAARVASIGRSLAGKLRPLQQCLATPMSEYLVTVHSEFAQWIKRVRDVETVPRGRCAWDEVRGVWDVLECAEGEPPLRSSLAADLFGMIHRTSRVVGESGSEWLLLNVVEAVIVPEVRLWCTEFEDELRDAATQPASLVNFPTRDQHAGGSRDSDSLLRRVGWVVSAPESETADRPSDAKRTKVTGLPYLLALLGSIEQCRLLVSAWRDSLEDALHSAEIEGSAGWSGSVLTTGSIHHALKNLSRAVVTCVVALLLQEPAVAGPLDQVATSAWLEEQLDQKLLRALGERCARVCASMASAKSSRKVLGELLKTLVTRYNQQLLLQMARRPAAKSSIWSFRRKPSLDPTWMAEVVSKDVQSLHAFFTHFGLWDTVTRSVLRQTQQMSALYACDMQEFRTFVILAATADHNFSIDVVEQILNARGVEATECGRVLHACAASLFELQQAYCPSLPPRDQPGSKHHPSVRITAEVARSESLRVVSCRTPAPLNHSENDEAAAVVPTMPQKSNDDYSWVTEDHLRTLAAHRPSEAQELRERVLASQLVSEEGVMKVKCIHDFRAQQPGDLTLSRGDEIVVTDFCHARWTWWEGYISVRADGTDVANLGAHDPTIRGGAPPTGTFPPNFCTCAGTSSMEPVMKVPMPEAAKPGLVGARARRQRRQKRTTCCGSQPSKG
jgi:hypothetical protein